MDPVSLHKLFGSPISTFQGTLAEVLAPADVDELVIGPGSAVIEGDTDVTSDVSFSCIVTVSVPEPVSR